MKDIEAREDILKLGTYIYRLLKLIDKLEDRIEILENNTLSIVKHCNKCKRPTVQVIEMKVWGKHYRCLNCGTLWECSRGTVCKEIKEKEKENGG